MRSLTETRFKIVGVAADFWFNPDDTGKVARLILYQGDVDQAAQRVK